MDQSNKIWHKHNPNDLIWWGGDPEEIGVIEFTFDKKTVYNVFRDYPKGVLTAKQKEIFDRENPFWKEYFYGKDAE